MAVQFRLHLIIYNDTVMIIMSSVVIQYHSLMIVSVMTFTILTLYSWQCTANSKSMMSEIYYYGYKVHVHYVFSGGWT